MLRKIKDKCNQFDSVTMIYILIITLNFYSDDISRPLSAILLYFVWWDIAVYLNIFSSVEANNYAPLSQRDHIARFKVGKESSCNHS